MTISPLQKKNCVPFPESQLIKNRISVGSESSDTLFMQLGTHSGQGQVLVQCKMKPGYTLKLTGLYGPVQNDWSCSPDRMDFGPSRRTRWDTSHDSDRN